jgi:spore maturation protein SpmA
VLNRVWIAFFVASFGAALVQTLFFGHPEVFNEIIRAIFEMTESAVKIAIGLIGLMALWLGIFRIAEHSGMVDMLSRGLSPLFCRLMPEVPKNHPAQSAITMNLAANLLGLDNAATPLGIKAMQLLQTLNPNPSTATNAQILFLVINTASVTLLPVTIFLYRAQAGSASPTDVFLPILIATCCSTLAGILAVSWVQKIRLWQPVILAYFLGFSLLMALLFLGIASLEAPALTALSSLTANMLLFGFIVAVIAWGALRKLEVYELFVEGAKEGFTTAINIIPYLVAMLVAIAALRGSGIFDLVINAISLGVAAMGLPTDFVASLPTGLMKPFSGSGARAMMLESFQHYGVDSLVGRMSAVMQGSTETTFYVLAVYFGSVGIRYGRHALACGLIADAAGITAAIFATYLFFG